MTKINAKVIAHSKNEFGNELLTVIVTFPRYILAELNTHRMLSKNSASSRAIPFEKMMDSVLNNPFVPIAWQKEHSGMQGSEYITDPKEIEKLNSIWLQARLDAIHRAQDLAQLKTTKQMINRLLEPFMYHTVIITGSEWENFFALRCPRYEYGTSTAEVGTFTIFRSRKDAVAVYPELKDKTEIEWLLLNKGMADIHMMALAEAMWDAKNESEPTQLKAGEWHIPFGDQITITTPSGNGTMTLGQHRSEEETIAVIKIASARCARISYTVVGEEGKPFNYEADIKLHDRLAKSGHMSPFEHCAQAMNVDQYENNFYSGNFKGFIQYRKTMPNENITK